MKLFIPNKPEFHLYLRQILGRLKAVADMACPFLAEMIDVERQILRRNLCLERIVEPRLDVLSFPDEFLFEGY